EGGVGRSSLSAGLLAPGSSLPAPSPARDGSCGSLPGYSGGTAPASYRLPYSSRPLPQVGGSGHTQGHADDAVFNVRGGYTTPAGRIVLVLEDDSTTRHYFL